MNIDELEETLWLEYGPKLMPSSNRRVPPPEFLSLVGMMRDVCREYILEYEARMKKNKSGRKK